MYDYANIDFVTFEKAPSFNKNGQVWIYADEDAYHLRSNRGRR